jgi:Beta-propeller repeat
MVLTSGPLKYKGDFMNRRRIRRALLGTLFVAAVCPRPMIAWAGSTATSLPKLPLRFEPNRGQSDPRILFSARGNRYGLHLTAGGTSEIVLRSTASEAAVLRLTLEGADQGAQAVGAEPLSGHSNYFLGNDPRAWRTDVPQFARVDVHEVYPGIGLSYYGHEGQVEYDFLVAPGADPGRIRLHFEGAKGVRLDEHGDLILSVDGGELIHHAPIVYQAVADERRPVTGRYLRYGDRDVGFQVGEYDSTRPLVIDPVLSYSTYLGGGNDDLGVAAAVDSSGNVYVTGITASTNFPLANPLQSSDPGDRSVFVAKLNPAGSALVYSTYLGGSGWDAGLDIAVDSSGSAYITGETSSLNFPTVNPLQPGNLGGSPPYDAFVAKLNPSGSALVYSTYLGGSGYDRGESITVDSSGNVYLAGPTVSTDFPLASPLQASSGGGEDGFVAKLNPAGSALVYSTYLGGSSLDYANGVAVDSSGNAYVTGWTSSANFPIANALQPTKLGVNDAFVSKLNPSGSAFVYSTYLGGSDDDFGVAIAADSSGNAYATGYTYSINFPTVNPFQASLAGSDDVFVAKLNPTGSGLTYSTYLGGSTFDAPYDIALDSAGRAHITGFTASTNFPISNPLQATNGGGQDGFVAALKPAGSALAYSTYLGGSGTEVGNGIACGSADDVYVTGYTTSTNFPTANPLQGTNAGGDDAFIIKLGQALPVELMQFSIE